jgi:3-oxoacyl-[acyl-carrier-protein] synthase-3
MKKPRRVKIAGIGKYLPENRVTSAELESRLQLQPGWIEHKTGVVERRHARGETQSQMGARAARAALEDARLQLSDVDLIICASGSPEQCIPCTAVLIQRELGAEAHGIPCFDVDSTCLSFLFGLEVAASFLASGVYRTVLVVSSELASVGVNWKEAESSVLMGDGACAVVVTQSRETEDSVMYPAAFTTFSEGAELARIQGGGTRFHPNNPETRPEMNLFHMEGPKIFRLAQKASVPFVDRYLKDLSWEADSLDAVVPHQASLFAVRMTAKACGFDPRKLIENIQTHGNCLAASIPMALHDGIRSGRIRRGDRVLLAGTAAGVSVGTMAVRY